jgi:hypothetical protein
MPLRLEREGFFVTDSHDLAQKRTVDCFRSFFLLFLSKVTFCMLKIFSLGGYFEGKIKEND